MKKKRVLIITGIIAAIAVIGVLIFSTKQPINTEKITYDTAKKGTLELVVSGTGNVQSINVQNFFARTSARIVEVNVKLLDNVKQGDLIAKLDDYDLNKAVEIAQYNYNSAYFKKQQLVSASIQDSNAIKQAQQQLNVASAQLDQAKNNKENNSVIKAPIDGTITTLNLKVNDYTSLTSLAGTITNSSQLEAVFNVNEIDITKVKLDQEVELEIDAINAKRIGKVTFIDTVGNNINGVINYIVKSTITDTKDLKPLMSINSNIKVEKKENVLIIPTTAIKTLDGKTFVQRVSKAADLNNIKTTDLEDVEITTGLNNNSSIEVLSGLNEGDNVVTSITKQASNGFGLGSN